MLFRRIGAAVYYLLILDGHRNWGFPKGHLDEAESPLAAAVREVAEETGLRDLVLHRELSTIAWQFRFRGRLIHKRCHFYLFESTEGTPVPQTEEGITQCVWLAASDAVARLSFDNARALLTAAAAMVGELSGGSRAAGP